MRSTCPTSFVSTLRQTVAVGMAEDAVEVERRLLAEGAMNHVEASYARVAEQNGVADVSRNTKVECLMMGYTEEDLKFGEGTNLGLGCGNPVALAKLQPGEVVVDLGSGPGFDCFLAGERVGPTGSVIGVDRELEMVKRARDFSKSRGAPHVSFRLGEIAYLPVADQFADVLISNGVLCLTLSPRQVYSDAFRILRPGGRFVFADMVLKKALPSELLTAQAFAS